MRKFHSDRTIFVTSLCAAAMIAFSIVLNAIGMPVDVLAVCFGSLVTLLSVRFYEELAKVLILKRGSIASLVCIGTAKVLLLLSFLYWIFNVDRATLLSAVAGLLIFIPAAFFARPSED